MISKEDEKVEIKNIKEIQLLLKKYPIRFCYLFGSQLDKSKTHPLSDYDFAVFLDKELSNIERFRIRLDIMGQLEDIVKNKVDCIILNDSPIILSYQIIKKGVIIYKNDKKSQEEIQYFEEKVIMLYLDFKPFSDQFIKWQKESVLNRKTEGR